MTAHNILGPYCRTCGVFASQAQIPEYATCEDVTRAVEAEKARVDAAVKAFCVTHPDGLYWVEHDGQLTVARLRASCAPRPWRPLDADETEQYQGVGIGSVTVIEGPIPPPAGREYP